MSPMTEGLLNVLRMCLIAEDGNVPVAPNAAAEACAEYVSDHGGSDELAERVHNLIFELTSDLVAEPGSYM